MPKSVEFSYTFNVPMKGFVLQITLNINLLYKRANLALQLLLFFLTFHKGVDIMRNKVLLSIFLAVFAFAVTSNADIIKITGVDNGSVAYISETGTSLPLSGPSYTGGVYTGLYNAVDLTTGQSELTYCIDPIGDINIGDQWTADLTTGTQLATGTAGVLSTPAYGSTAAVTAQKYEMISYLADKYYYDLTSANPMANTNNSATAINDRSDLSLAFWEIDRDYDGTSGSLNLSAGNFKVTSGDLSFTQSLIADAYANHAPPSICPYIPPREDLPRNSLCLILLNPARFGF